MTILSQIDAGAAPPRVLAPAPPAPPAPPPRRQGDEALRIALLAPPWFSVPPLGYGGIEYVVHLLGDELVRQGHAVTLFAAPGTVSRATVHTLLDRVYPDRIGCALIEADHVGRAFEQLDLAARAGLPFDVLHDHSGFTALAMADRVDVPAVHTVHGAFTEDTSSFYSRHGRKAAIVAISHSQCRLAPPDLSIDAVVPNPVAVADWPFRRRKDDYLLWVGRMSPQKGPHRAIEAARRAGRRLVLAGPVQTGQEGYFEAEVRPAIDGDRVCYLGEVTGRAKEELFARAVAFLMPIRWAEPFGMVMVEALACGTPVIAFPEGAASEIVMHGENGFLVDDEVEMASAVDGLGRLDPARCRASVASRYDVEQVAAAYVEAYRRAMPQPLRSAPGASLVRLPASHRDVTPVPS